MKKLFAAVMLSVSVLSLSACGVQMTDEADKENSHGFTYEAVAVDGDMFGCTFENRGWDIGTMSCIDLHTKAAIGAENAQGFTREVVTVRGSKLDCIFENRGWDSGTMSCLPLAT